MDKEPKPYTVDPEVKEQIEKEGWEDNAQIVFKRREEEGQVDPTKYEQLEHFTTLSAYLRAQKKMLFSKEETIKLIQDHMSDLGLNPTHSYHFMLNLKGGKLRGDYLEFRGNTSDKTTIFYIDKGDNWVEVKIDFSKISELDGQPGLFEQKMMGLGFKFRDLRSVEADMFLKMLDFKRARIQKQAEESKAGEFDF